MVKNPTQVAPILFLPPPPHPPNKKANKKQAKQVAGMSPYHTGGVSVFISPLDRHIRGFFPRSSCCHRTGQSVCRRTGRHRRLLVSSRWWGPPSTSSSRGGRRRGKLPVLLANHYPSVVVADLLGVCDCASIISDSPWLIIS